ncbi:MAG: pyridoxal-phosphate dependent enzyme [Rhodobacteraceae bacterium]|nr:pyridoxal-phosphate dependent enzyme [Paracoccaceae bacterium]
MTVSPPNLHQLRARHRELAGTLIRTPTVRCASDKLRTALGDADIHLKLEMLQHTGSFKARGALSVVAAIPQADRNKGITAVSAGNHAIAAAWAARRAGISAKVVLMASVNAYRLALTKAEGAEVVIKKTPAEAFAHAAKLAETEGRTFVHPFEGVDTTLGAAGVGLELIDDVPDLDAVVVSVGGGGLISGVSSAIKAVNPTCQVYGVEPVGADSLARSLARGEPVSLDTVDTLADSLGAPMALPYGFGVNQKCVDDVVTVTDEAICAGLALFQEEAKLAVEPAAGAIFAAALDPLRDRLAGKKIGFVVCGANIDAQSYAQVLQRGQKYLKPLLSGAALT